jgi:hypothetical protein
MIPKSSGWSALVQFVGYRTTVTFLRKSVSLGCAAQLCTKRMIRVSKERRNEQKISVIIHALLFAWYLTGNFLTSLKHPGFEDFPITIGTCLLLQSLLTHSSTVSLSVECFPIQQMSTPCKFFSSCMHYHISVFVCRSCSSRQI